MASQTMYQGRRELTARLFQNMGLTSLLEHIPKQRILVVLNYHRVGNPCTTLYDPGLFSATAKEFEEQVAHLKRYFHMATLDEAVGMVTGEIPMRRSILITFDDGYLDNYSLAFPILRAHGIQAVFFLPTSFIGTNHIPWWDVIAYVITNSKREVIRLQYPEPVEFDVARDGVAKTITHVLRLYKQPGMTNHERFLEELQSACDSSLPPPNTQRSFMNWQEAREMQQGGMAFGSHTHTHEILSKLSIERQHNELRMSREVLESELSQRIDVLAYPVGKRNMFTTETIKALETNGYRAAFSFYGGFNLPGRTEPFDISRVGVDPQSRSRFRLKMALAACTGAVWF